MQKRVIYTRLGIAEIDPVKNTINGLRLDPLNPLHSEVAKHLNKEALEKEKALKTKEATVLTETYEMYIAFCPHCKFESDPNESERQAILDISKAIDDITVCRSCGKRLITE